MTGFAFRTRGQRQSPVEIAVEQSSTQANKKQILFDTECFLEIVQIPA
jgi:hypothetical protein